LAGYEMGSSHAEVNMAYSVRPEVCTWRLPCP
jgi:hypothetical protein